MNTITRAAIEGFLSAKRIAVIGEDVWLHRHVAGGVTDMSAVSCAHMREINLITGYCMFMFLPNSPLIHRFHGSLLKLIGKYPQSESKEI